MLSNMSDEQLGAMMDALPMDLSFIDEQDNVRFWNRDEKRGPAWQPSQLGKPVTACHKEQSRPAVNAVIDKLKSGKRDVVDRTVTRDGQVIRFRWFAIRNDAGEYLGCLEMVQRDGEVAGPPQGQQ
ncbi:PAS domain-containing protein [Chloroflexota bacterium]